MAKSKPYLDAALTRSKMVQNIASLINEKELPPALEQKCYALTSFYLNPPPSGMQYHWNAIWVMCYEFNQLYTKLQSLLFTDIEAAKQHKTQLKRRIEAAELTISIWENGHHFDEETGMVIVVPTPSPSLPLTSEEAELRRASINATWRRGNTNS